MSTGGRRSWETSGHLLEAHAPAPVWSVHACWDSRLQLSSGRRGLYCSVLASPGLQHWRRVCRVGRPVSVSERQVLEMCRGGSWPTCHGTRSSGGAGLREESPAAGGWRDSGGSLPCEMRDWKRARLCTSCVCARACAHGPEEDSCGVCRLRP